MIVDVADRLPSVASAIHDHSIAGLMNTKLAGNLLDNDLQMTQQARIFRRCMLKRIDLTLWDDQHMHGGFGVEVMERQTPFIFENDFCGYLFSNDFGKNGFRHILGLANASAGGCMFLQVGFSSKSNCIPFPKFGERQFAVAQSEAYRAVDAMVTRSVSEEMFFPHLRIGLCLVVSVCRSPKASYAVLTIRSFFQPCRIGSLFLRVE